MLSTSILAALGAMIAWGVGDFLIQRSTRKLGDVETLAWIGLIGSIGLLPFIWGDLYLVFERSSFLILLLLGIVCFVIGIINFEALKRGKLSVIEVLLELELPITVLLGLFFLSEYLSPVQILLVVIIFIGILLIAIKPGQIKKRHFLEKGVVLGVIAALGYGLINFLTAVGAKEVSPLLTIWFPWVIFTLISISYLAYQRKLGLALTHVSKYPSLIVSMAVIDTLAWVLFALAVEKKELAVTIAITESYPAISLVLGILVNKEKISKLQIFGAAITICASFLIGLVN